MSDKSTLDNFIPYGDEWRKEMMKLPKSFLLDIITKLGKHDDERAERVARNELKIVYNLNQPHGIRDKNGYLLFFPEITKYPDQEDRYKKEVQDCIDLSNLLFQVLSR